VLGDPTLGKPTFVRSEDGRDQMPSGPDYLGVAADGVRPIDQVKDGIDAVGMIDVKRSITSTAWLSYTSSAPRRRPSSGSPTDRRDDMRTARTGHLHRVVADPAGGAHHHDVLACGGLEQLNRPRRRDRRDGQRAAAGSTEVNSA